MLDGNVLLRVGTFAVLLLPELELHQILPCGMLLAVLRADALHEALVAGAVIIHALFRLIALCEILRHFPRQLQVDKGRTAPALADDGVEHLDGLRHCPPHDGAGDIRKVVRRRMEKLGALPTAVGLEVVSGGGAGLVVLHPLFQKGDQLVAGFYRNVAEFAEG